MRRIGRIVVGFQAALVATFAVALGSRWFPLGVPGEWEWQRVRSGPSVLAAVVGILGVTLFATFASLGFKALSRSKGFVAKQPG